jgi:hypothetical protein
MSRPGQGYGKGLEILDDHVRLMRCFAERALTTIDEGRPHAVGFGTNAVESVISDEQAARPLFTSDSRGGSIGLPVWFEETGFLN